MFEREYRQQLHGTIAKKTALSEEALGIRQAEFNRILSAVAINMLTAPLGLFVFPIGQATTKDPYEYEIILNSGNPIRIVNQYSGFNVGECVAVFLSENWEQYPPRMAYSTTQCSH